LYVKPDAPIFEKEVCQKMRALIAAGIGCDYLLPGGIPGLGITAINIFIKQMDLQHPDLSSEERCNKLLDFDDKEIKTPMVQQKLRENKMDLSREVIKCCALAMLYEPCNLFGVIRSKDYIYAHGPPKALLGYLEGFCGPNINCDISDDVETFKCCGSGDSHHLVLAGEGKFTCNYCSAFVCRYHTSVDAPKANITPVCCLGCYVNARDIILPQNGDANGGSYGADQQKMREELSRINKQLPASATYAEVFQYYDKLVLNDAIHYFDEDIANVSYPVLSRDQMDSLPAGFEFDLTNGGSFVQEPNLKDKQLLGLLSIFSQLVTISGALSKLYKSHSVVPDCFLGFASGA
jgi:hypothetical protein